MVLRDSMQQIPALNLKGDRKMNKVIKNEFIKMLKEKKFYVLVAVLIGSIVLMAITKDSSINAQNFVFETLAGMVIKPILLAFMIIVIAGVITEDYANGTMKFSLITPVKRSQLMVGKILFIYLYAVILLAVCFVASYVVCIAVIGVPSQLMNNFISNIKCYAYILLPLLAFCTLISFIAMLINNMGEIIGIGLGIQFMTIIIDHSIKSAMYYLAGGGMYLFDFVRASGDLKTIQMPRITLCSCIYIAIFMLLSVIVMKKKDLVL